CSMGVGPSSAATSLSSFSSGTLPRPRWTNTGVKASLSFGTNTDTGVSGVAFNLMETLRPSSDMDSLTRTDSGASYVTGSSPRSTIERGSETTTGADGVRDLYSWRSNVLGSSFGAERNFSTRARYSRLRPTSPRDWI